MKEAIPVSIGMYNGLLLEFHSIELTSLCRSNICIRRPSQKDISIRKHVPQLRACTRRPTGLPIISEVRKHGAFPDNSPIPSYDLEVEEAV